MYHYFFTSSDPASVTLNHAQYWVVLFHPKTAATRWGRFPFSKTTIVYRTYRCIKWTRIAVLVATCPGHHSTGQLYRTPLASKSIQYIHGYSPGRVFPDSFLLCRLPMLFHHVPRQISRRNILPTLSALYPSLMSLPVGGSLSRHLLNVRRLQLGPCRLEWPPTIPTVFLFIWLIWPLNHHHVIMVKWLDYLSQQTCYINYMSPKFDSRALFGMICSSSQDLDVACTEE